MRKYSKSLNCSILILVTSLLYVFTGCEQTDEMEASKEQNISLEIVSDIVKLVDDSTNVAGYIEVASPVPDVELRWNFLPGCNVDTTQTKFAMKNGVSKIPVRWIAKNKDGVYASSSKAFAGGVLVSAGNISKYVHLIWADKIDSTEIAKEKELVTRSAKSLPRAVNIDLNPETVDMDIVVGGGVAVEFSGASLVVIDQTRIGVSTNIDKSIIPKFITQTEFIEFNWIDGKAPDMNFSTGVDFKAGGIISTCYINYIVPVEEPLVWEFISSSVTDGNNLPATGATIIITVKTNKPWSIESGTAEISPVPDYGTGIGTKALTLHIQDNPGPDPRPVSVLVKSQDVLKEALTFTQLAPNGTEDMLEFISSDPISGATIPSGGITATVKVKASTAWWIDLNGSKTNFPAGAMGEKTGTISIPASTSTTNQIVNYTIGYDNTVVKSISYIQPAQGSDAGGTLDYVSSNLPTGNIPADGGTYTFIFSGTYTGTVQVRALLDGVEQAPGAGVTNKQPQITVPANPSTNSCNIIFQYRLIDVAGAPWEDLPTSTNRIQDGSDNGSGGNISHESILPGGDIPEDGGVYSCKFTGGPGSVMMRAMKAGVEIARTTASNVSPSTGTTVSINLPGLNNEKNTTITFEYSTDGGATWNTIETRNQVNFVLVVNVNGPVKIPAMNGSVSFSVIGNYPYPVTVYARYNNAVIGQATALRAPQDLVVLIPNNTTGAEKSIDFFYTRGGDNQSFTIGIIKQAAQ